MTSHTHEPVIDVPRFVIVTGPPAAGKTTIARVVATRLGLPLVAKDDLKEVLGEALGVRGRDESRRLGVATFDVQFHLLDELIGAGCSVVAEGNFATSRASRFTALPPARTVQVHVTAAPETLRARMLARAADGRHPVHYDAEVAHEIAVRARTGEWDPLPLRGETVRVDTTSRVDPAAIADLVATMLG